MPFDLAAPLCRVCSKKTAAIEIQALNGIFALALSRQPTDSPPATCLPDDSDSSRCLAEALAPQVCDTAGVSSRSGTTLCDRSGPPHESCGCLCALPAPGRRVSYWGRGSIVQCRKCCPRTPLCSPPAGAPCWRGGYRGTISMAISETD
jgi:hypothetical protein